MIVTARRKEENLQSVPVSVAAISSQALQAQSIGNTYDLQRAAPGLTVSPTPLGPNRPAFQIRGQRTQAARISSDPAVVVYFAEVGSSRAAGSTQSLFDIDSIQVLKGPQGTLFGRNTTGGAILITPRAPEADFGGYGKATLGSFSRRSFEGVLNAPLGDMLSLRLGAQASRRDGFTTNTFLANQKGGDEDYSSYRATLRFKPNDSVTSDLIGTFFYSNITGDQSKLAEFIPAAFPVAALVPALQADLARIQQLGFYETRNSIPSRYKDNVKGLQNTTTIDIGSDSPLLGNATIKNIAGYRRIRNYFTNNTDGTSLSIVDLNGTYVGDQFSEELQLQGQSGKFDYIIGGFYSVESGTDFSRQMIFGALPLSLTEIRGKNTSFSAFAHGGVDLSDLHEGLSLSGGARLTQDKRYLDTRSRQQRTPTAANPAAFLCTATVVTFAIPTLNSDQCSVVTRAKFTEPTWDVSLNWQIDGDHLVYVAHRHGYRSGLAANGVTPRIRPEKVNDIEVGSKNQFHVGNTAVRFNATGYYGWYKDLQRSIAVIANGATLTADRNAAKAHVYGLETELNLRFNSWLSADASYVLTKAKYDDFSNTFQTATGSVTVDNTSSIFNNTPEHTLAANVNVNVPTPASAGAVSMSLGYNYQSSFQTTDSNSQNCGPPGPGGLGLERWCLSNGGKLKGYGLFNGRVSWRNVLGANVDLAVFATNLTDKKYIPVSLTTLNALGFRAIIPGPPRMVGVELRVPFGSEKY